jgi:hypothetical protein
MDNLKVYCRESSVHGIPRLVICCGALVFEIALKVQEDEMSLSDAPRGKHSFGTFNWVVILSARRALGMMKKESGYWLGG